MFPPPQEPGNPRSTLFVVRPSIFAVFLAALQAWTRIFDQHNSHPQLQRAACPRCQKYGTSGTEYCVHKSPSCVCAINLRIASISAFPISPDAPFGTCCLPGAGGHSQRRFVSHFAADGIYRGPSSSHCPEHFHASRPDLIFNTVSASGFRFFQASHASSLSDLFG